MPPTHPRYYNQIAGGSGVADLNDVLMAVGRLQEGQDRMREDFTAEKQSALVSRKALHERHDDLSRELGSLKTDVAVSGTINAQVREEVKSLGRKIDQHKEDIQPSIDDWRKIKTLGLGITGILAIGGLTVGAMLTMGFEYFKTVLRSLLG